MRHLGEYWRLSIVCTLLVMAAGCTTSTPPLEPLPTPANVVHLPQLFVSKNASRFGDEGVIGVLKGGEATLMTAKLACADAESRDVIHQPIVAKISKDGTIQHAVICEIREDENLDDIFTLNAVVGKLKSRGRHQVRLIAGPRTLGEAVVVAE